MAYYSNQNVFATRNNMKQTNDSPSSKQRRQQWLSFINELSPETEPETIQLIGLMHRTAHAMKQLGETSLAEAGLSYSQYRVLMNLLFSEQFEGQPALNPSDLSERQGLSRNTMSALIRNLEKEGLIERQLDEQDRRRFLIRLTDPGRDKVTNHATQHLTTIHSCFNGLSQDERATMTQLLERIGSHPALSLNKTAQAG